MKSIVYYLEMLIMFTFQFAFILGLILLFIYVVANWYYQSSYFRRTPTWIKTIIYRVINVTRVWGPNCLIFYILGRLVISLMNFLTRAF